MEVNRGLPADKLVSYFHRDGLNWSIMDSVHGLIEFKPMNLIGVWPKLPQMDLVLMRYVLSPFGEDHQRNIVALLHSKMNPEGTLFLGVDENPAGITDFFEPIYYGPHAD